MVMRSSLAGPCFCLALAISPALVASPAAGQESGDNPEARAEALFRQGRELLAQGQTEPACEAFRASQALHPSAAALGNIAACLEARGDRAGALRSFEAARDLSRRDPRADLREARVEAANAAIERLEPQVAELTLRLPAGAALRVTLDAEAVAVPSAGGTARVWANPGEHRLQVDSPGAVPYVQHLQLAAAQATEVVVPPLAARDAAKEEAASGPSLSTWLLIGGGTAIAAGAVVGGLAWAPAGRMERRCPEGEAACNTVSGSDLRSTRHLANAATALWAVGLVGAGAGLTLLLLDGDAGDRSDVGRVAATCTGVGCSMALDVVF